MPLVADMLDRLKTALQDRYTIEREIGRGRDGDDLLGPRSQA